MPDAKQFIAAPFTPAGGLANGHMMTLAPLFHWRQFALPVGQRLEIEVATGSRITGYLHRPTSGPYLDRKALLIVLHGLESSAQASYVKGLCEKALRAGLSVFRMNMRNCEGTLELCDTLYNAGLSSDLEACAGYLLKTLPEIEKIFACGFSLGGNIVLKAAGENNAADTSKFESASSLQAKSNLKGVVAISPPVELETCVQALEAGVNQLYGFNFLLGLKNKIVEKEKLYPGKFDLERLKTVRTLREFDNYFTAIDAGYDGASAYYHGASARRVIDKISMPALIIAAQDDPLVPFDKTFGFLQEGSKSNPNSRSKSKSGWSLTAGSLQLLSSEYGGHVSYIGKNGGVKASNLDRHKIADRYWAESQAVLYILHLLDNS